MGSTKGVFGLHLGPLCMIVMDYVGGTHLEALEETERPEDLHDKVKVMVDRLHGSGFMFGDLRPPNVMVSDGEVHYPDGLGENITRCCKGKDFGVIEQQHDLDLLDYYFRKTWNPCCGIFRAIPYLHRLYHRTPSKTPLLV